MGFILALLYIASCAATPTVAYTRTAYHGFLTAQLRPGGLPRVYPRTASPPSIASTTLDAGTLSPYGSAAVLVIHREDVVPVSGVAGAIVARGSSPEPSPPRPLFREYRGAFDGLALLTSETLTDEADDRRRRADKRRSRRLRSWIRGDNGQAWLRARQTAAEERRATREARVRWIAAFACEFPRQLARWALVAGSQKNAGIF